MHQNTFFTTTDVKKYLFKEHDPGGLEVCAKALKHVFNTPDFKKYQFEEQYICGLEVSANASKHVFNHSSQ